jgi:hypothetical protein
MKGIVVQALRWAKDSVLEWLEGPEGRALSCESGSVNVIFTGNLGSGFGGNSNPVFNQIGTGQGKLNNTANEFQ